MNVYACRSSTDPFAEADLLASSMTTFTHAHPNRCTSSIVEYSTTFLERTYLRRTHIRLCFTVMPKTHLDMRCLLRERPNNLTRRFVSAFNHNILHGSSPCLRLEEHVFQNILQGSDDQINSILHSTHVASNESHAMASNSTAFGHGSTLVEQYTLPHLKTNRK